MLLKPKLVLLKLNLVSSLLYSTRAMHVLKLPAFETKKYTADDRFYGNGPYGGILTKKEPIRTLGFTLPYKVTYLILFLVSKHLGPRSKRTIGFCRVLAVPGDPMSRCSSSSLSPLSSSMFFSARLSSCGHQGST